MTRKSTSSFNLIALLRASCNIAGLRSTAVMWQFRGGSKGGSCPSRLQSPRPFPMRVVIAALGIFLRPRTRRLPRRNHTNEQTPRTFSESASCPWASANFRTLHEKVQSRVGFGKYCSQGLESRMKVGPGKWQMDGRDLACGSRFRASGGRWVLPMGGPWNQELGQGASCSLPCPISLPFGWQSQMRDGGARWLAPHRRLVWR